MRFTVLSSIMVAALAAPIAAAGHDGMPQHGISFNDNPGLVEQVRQATQQFRDIRTAKGAGYEKFLGCVSGAQEGAMGVHFVNGPFVMDGELDVDRPEALIYEPRGNTYRFVGVEYIVPADLWHMHHDEPPVLEGQLLQYNGSPNRYGLAPFYEIHVWATRENPHGAFADWNPRVSCEGQ